MARTPCYKQASDQGFVFSLAIGGANGQDKGVFKLVTVWGDEGTACSSASVGGRAIGHKSLVARCVIKGAGVGLTRGPCRLYDKVSKGLSFDRAMGLI